MRTAVDQYPVFNWLFFLSILFLFSVADNLYLFDLFIIPYFVSMAILNASIFKKNIQISLLIALHLIFIYISSMHLLALENIALGLLYKTYLCFLVIAMSFYLPEQKSSFFDTTIYVFILSGTFQALLGIAGFGLSLDTLMWEGRAKGLLEDPNSYGAFVGAALLFCVQSLFSQNKNRTILALSLFALTIGLFLSFSRVGIASTFTLCFVLCLIYRSKINIKYMSALLLFTSTILLLTLLIFGDRIAPLIEVRFDLNQDQDTGRYGRIYMFVLALQLIFENPLGVGILQQGLYLPNQVHNIFLSLTLSYGWMAGCFFFITTFLTFISYIRILVRHGTDNKATVITMALLLQYLIMMVQAGEWWRHFWFLLGFTWAYYGHITMIKNAAKNRATAC